jgi:hypothetical protein
MAIIRYTSSAATASWIDAATGLPEVDKNPPSEKVSDSFLTGSLGFRFVNFMEVWVDFNTELNSITGHGFTPRSGIYRAPSFAHIPSTMFNSIRDVKVGKEPITFSQIVGCRTKSPETIGTIVGGVVGGAYALNPIGGAVAGRMAASKISGFPPIWSEIRIKIYDNGTTEAEVVRHSLFPSLTFYKLRQGEKVSYEKSKFDNQSYFNAIPNLKRWETEGWGATRGSSGAIAGNPWNLTWSAIGMY